mmetsp:Transcript_143116/g.457333  ORF Transcript_143116/g.457333 Transcript_143116/m.457333 type:complete len:316 (+) Transcript_143116:515-1462(+)
MVSSFIGFILLLPVLLEEPCRLGLHFVPMKTSLHHCLFLSVALSDRSCLELLNLGFHLQIFLPDLIVVVQLQGRLEIKVGVLDPVELLVGAGADREGLGRVRVDGQGCRAVVGGGPGLVQFHQHLCAPDVVQRTGGSDLDRLRQLLQRQLQIAFLQGFGTLSLGSVLLVLLLVCELLDAGRRHAGERRLAAMVPKRDNPGRRRGRQQPDAWRWPPSATLRRRGRRRSRRRRSCRCDRRCCRGCRRLWIGCANVRQDFYEFNRWPRSRNRHDLQFVVADILQRCYGHAYQSLFRLFREMEALRTRENFSPVLNFFD